MENQKYSKYTFVDGLEWLTISLTPTLFDRNKLEVVAERKIGDLFYKPANLFAPYIYGTDSPLSYPNADSGRSASAIPIRPTHLLLKTKFGLKKTTSSELLSAEFDVVIPSDLFYREEYKNLNVQ
jgi:hypothetical protein